VAADSDFVITIVSDAVALRAVREGAQGIASGARPGLVALEMSTVGPEAIRALRETLPASSALFDAPVHGPPASARAGSLAIFAGGDADVLERARPVLELLGSVLHVGPLGSAAGAKLIVQTTLVGTGVRSRCSYRTAQPQLLGHSAVLHPTAGHRQDRRLLPPRPLPHASHCFRQRARAGSGEFSRG
jgi:3-hydroxyisobutyrate dehydrogenase-like beta-hydroxyacid dehydrogenase